MGKTNGGGNPNHDPKTGRFISVSVLKSNDWKDLQKKALPYANLDIPRDNLYQYSNDKGKAFIRYRTDTAYIYSLGSTGGHAGTEAFIHALEDMQKNSKHGANWEATGDSPEYYTHLGLNKYANNEYGTYHYHIPQEDLKDVIVRLKKEAKQWQQNKKK